MIKVENIETAGFESAIMASRNPMNSWNKSDSEFDVRTYWDDNNELEAEYYPVIMGDNDLDLLQRLYKAGVEHRTYARLIQVWMDVTAPLYWWKGADRYTIGKSQVSTSTMHKIHSKEFTVDDFSCEHLTTYALNEFQNYLSTMNFYRDKYLKSKNKEDWWQMIQMLPSSYNQKRTINMSYEVVFKMIKERTGHKLDEWNDFVAILKDLPYVREIMNEGGN